MGLVCDARSGGALSETALRRLDEVCTLGVYRVAMSRQIGPRDLLAYRTIRTIVDLGTGAQILHGHGAKGGAYARLVANALKKRGRSVRAFYTPHGGSLHYSPSNPLGRIYAMLERRMAPMTDGLIFESAFGARAYAAHIAPPPCEWQAIPNGLRPDEFYESIVEPDAADFVLVGELRHLKGVDVFLRAISALRRHFPVRAVIVGEGPDERAFRNLAERLKLGAEVRFAGAMPARMAFARGRCLVVPSRAESLPYIVLEAAAARKPLIATNVGGIPEIVQGADMPLVEPNNARDLRIHLAAFLSDPKSFAARAERLQEIVSERYTAAEMTRAILEFYRRQVSAEASH